MKESLLGPCSLLMVVCVCARTHTHTAHTRTDDTRGSGGRHAQGHRPRTQTHRCCSRAACEGCDSCPCPRKPMLCQYLVLLHSPDACSYSWSPCECESSLRVLPRIVSIDCPLLFLQKQNLANAIYLFGLGTLLTGLGLKHVRIRSHHDLAGALVTPLLLGRPWWSTTSPTCLPLSVLTITSDQH